LCTVNWFWFTFSWIETLALVFHSKALFHLHSYIKDEHSDFTQSINKIGLPSLILGVLSRFDLSGNHVGPCRRNTVFKSELLPSENWWGQGCSG
jgi:hypothetical protein